MGACSLLGLLTLASRGPDLSWDSRRAFHKSPPNELDRHGPSRRGLLDHPSQCSQHWPVDTFSVVTIRRISQMLQVRLRLRDPMLDWAESSPLLAVGDRILLPWHSMATSNTLCSSCAQPLLLFPLERLRANLSFKWVGPPVAAPCDLL